MPTVLRFIEPCLPSPADRPPSGANWIHEIKHDGYRLMARRDSVGIRLITRRGNDWSERFPLVVEAVNHLKVRSCLIDGEVVCCDERGLARFDLLRRRHNEARSSTPSTCWNSTAPTYAGNRSRSARRRWRASCARAGPACGSTSTWEHDCGLTGAAAVSAAKALSPSGSARHTAPAARPTGSSSRTRTRRQSGVRLRRIGADDPQRRRQHPPD